MATLAVQTLSKPVPGLKNILFATDFSEASMKAFPYEAALGKKFGASVFACHIIKPPALIAAAPRLRLIYMKWSGMPRKKSLDKIVQSPLLEGIKRKSIAP